MLTLEAVQLRQGDFALDADFALPTGARAAVIGPSGAGKSTLLLAIAGLVPLASGRILWQGRDLAPLKPGDRPLSILFQDQNLFPHLTVAQNVALGLGPRPDPGPAGRARVAAVLARVGLDGFGPRRPGTLAGGEQGRVALARTLLRARPLLLLDEPFAALGPALKAEMLELLAGLLDETGATLMMVTHDPADARAIAGQAILVAEGRAAPPVAVPAFFADPPAALRRYLG